MDTGASDVFTVVILMAAVGMRLLLVALVVWVLIPRRRVCPKCGEETAAVLGPPAYRWLLLQQRWCMACGWQGMARRSQTAGAGSPRNPTIRVPAVAVLFFGGATAGCGGDSGSGELTALFADSAAWIDLTHPFDSTTIYWPTAQPFDLDMVAEGQTPGGYFYAAAVFSAAEHGGTHLDAPVHFAEGRHSTDQIPLERFIGPAVVVDVTGQASSNPDYLVTPADLERFESDHGRMADGAIVLFRTGWGQRWPDRRAYLGTDQTGPGAVPLLHFPGVDSSAARWLLNRPIDAVGIDTPSIDYGQSTTFDTHRILFARNIPAFENVANLDRLPPTGAFVVALPMKIGGGTGGPLRIVAALPGSVRAN